ncbi:isoprenoid synthase domain-containing protein [Podospora australis]|uniref:Isoprenoid synthase domain-containing protein n=1 Tax=Podospora australis TaxID=1536484 RepID=A0AAN6WRI3_9PEZI|nr:isoprenoid synthase domain-containing protein [Podospora australis]
MPHNETLSPNPGSSDIDAAETLDLHGFCPKYPLARHKHEVLANAGCADARQDWIKHIGPASEFGGCNPVNGNFTALVLPLCKPERLRLVAYMLEYAFLHDNVVEVLPDGNKNTTKGSGDAFSLGEGRGTHIKTGRKQIQAKMMLQLMSTDKVCAAWVLNVWKAMLATTLKDKAKDLSNLEEYLDFRIVDTGAPFVESTMLFGMGMTLTEEEDTLLAPLIRPCYASLALANDYFSFDREWEEIQSKPGASQKLLNAVWLYMKWNGVEAEVAKRRTREACNRYEQQYLDNIERFRREHASDPNFEKLDRYLRGLAQQVSGNVIWSLNCPRYHPDQRYNPNAGIEDELTAQARGSETDNEEHVLENKRLSVTTIGSTRCSDSDIHTTYSWERESSRSSSLSWTSDDGQDDEHGSEKRRSNMTNMLTEERLGTLQLNAPFDYVASVPTTHVRDTMADALNVWTCVPEDTLNHIKDVVNHLQNASLLLYDDVYSGCSAYNRHMEDNSDLRRGQPAAHTVFGVPQTINSASFAIVDALQKANNFEIPRSVDVAFEQLRDMHIGQSYDLHWSRHVECPSEEEYLELVAKKTGGLFRLLSRLMCANVRDDKVSQLIDNLVSQIGIFFQIRDDFQNISSAAYTSQKGFCEDLDKGKLSVPLVQFLNNAPLSDTIHVREVLEQRREKRCLSTAQKELVLKPLKGSKSMDVTLETLHRLQADIENLTGQLEERTGRENWVLKLCMYRLRV